MEEKRFPEVTQGVEDIFIRNSDRVRGLMLSCGNGKSEGMGRLQLKFPSRWGSGYFLETHIDFSHFVIDTINRL